jgi:hypothetical protein
MMRIHRVLLLLSVAPTICLANSSAVLAVTYWFLEGSIYRLAQTVGSPSPNSQSSSDYLEIIETLDRAWPSFRPSGTTPDFFGRVRDEVYASLHDFNEGREARARLFRSLGMLQFLRFGITREPDLPLLKDWFQRFKRQVEQRENLVEDKMGPIRDFRSLNSLELYALLYSLGDTSASPRSILQYITALGYLDAARQFLNDYTLGRGWNALYFEVPPWRGTAHPQRLIRRRE